METESIVGVSSLGTRALWGEWMASPSPVYPEYYPGDPNPRGPAMPANLHPAGGRISTRGMTRSRCLGDMGTSGLKPGLYV